MKRLVTVLLAALALAACSAPEPTGRFIGIDGKPLVANGEIDASVQQALTADPAACARAGGAVRPVCRMHKPMCVISFPDAGKNCTDGKQCASGRCATQEVRATWDGPVTGVCKANNDPCGCQQYVNNGAASPALCVD